METDQNRNRAEIYLKEKTYTCVETIDNRYYHGFLITVNTEYLIIKDRKLGKFPISFREITNVSVSQQVPSAQEVEDTK